MSLAMRWTLFVRWLKRLFYPQPVMYLAPGYEGYGGATITQEWDGAGAEWIACCARQASDNYFGFFAFKNGVNVPLSPRVSGRGQFNRDGQWTAWEGSTKHSGMLPGWTPKADSNTAAIESELDALQLQITQLQATIASLPPTVTGATIRVPASGGNEGGEIQLAATDGGPNWVIDVYQGALRLHRGGVVVQQWVKP